MESNRKRLIAALISFFIVGGGQVYTGRFWTGIIYAIFFYGIIASMKILFIEANLGFHAAIASLVIFWLFNIVDAYKGPRYIPPPCEKACPAGIAPWIYVNQVGSKAAWKYPFIPFFKTMELVCPAPCEDRCTRRGIDEAVAIRYLKNGVTAEKTADGKNKKKDKKIAVIGAGPCGLTAAYELANKGYEVTVYEKDKKPGGIPAALIPDFRLSSETAEQEVKSLLHENIKLKCDVEIGKDISFENLIRDNHAVFVATGAWQQSKLGIPGEEKSLDAFNILRRIKNGEKFNLGNVVVIGGGNTAIDVARSLRRMGSNVKIYYRRRIEAMPCEHEDRIEAIEEGIKIIPLTIPVGCVQNSIMMAKTQCGEGRKGPVEIIKGSEFDVKVDNIVCAIGQQPETGFLKEYVKTDEQGRILVKNSKTNHPKVFAGGDAVLGPQTVAHAVGHGLTAAQNIDFKLRSVPGLWRWFTKSIFYPKAIKALTLTNGSRLKVPHREVAKRIADFKPIELAVSAEELCTEANRCLTCPIRYAP